MRLPAVMVLAALGCADQDRPLYAEAPDREIPTPPDLGVTLVTFEAGGRPQLRGAPLHDPSQISDLWPQGHEAVDVTGRVWSNGPVDVFEVLTATDRVLYEARLGASPIERARIAKRWPWFVAPRGSSFQIVWFDGRLHVLDLAEGDRAEFDIGPVDRIEAQPWASGTWAVRAARGPHHDLWRVDGQTEITAIARGLDVWGGMQTTERYVVLNAEDAILCIELGGEIRRFVLPEPVRIVGSWQDRLLFEPRGGTPGHTYLVDVPSARIQHLESGTSFGPDQLRQPFVAGRALNASRVRVIDLERGESRLLSAPQPVFLSSVFSDPERERVLLVLPASNLVEARDPVDGTLLQQWPARSADSAPGRLSPNRGWLLLTSVLVDLMTGDTLEVPTVPVRTLTNRRVIFDEPPLADRLLTHGGGAPRRHLSRLAPSASYDLFAPLRLVVAEHASDHRVVLQPEATEPRRWRYLSRVHSHGVTGRWLWLHTPDQLVWLDSDTLERVEVPFEDYRAPTAWPHRQSVVAQGPGGWQELTPDAPPRRLEEAAAIRWVEAQGDGLWAATDDELLRFGADGGVSHRFSNPQHGQVPRIFEIGDAVFVVGDRTWEVYASLLSSPGPLRRLPAHASWYWTSPAVATRPPPPFDQHDRLLSLDEEGVVATDAGGHSQHLAHGSFSFVSSDATRSSAWLALETSEGGHRLWVSGRVEPRLLGVIASGEVVSATWISERYVSLSLSGWRHYLVDLPRAALIEAPGLVTHHLEETKVALHDLAGHLHVFDAATGESQRLDPEAVGVEHIVGVLP